MNMRTSPDRWQAYSGKWYFSFCDDYCLTLRPTRSGVSLHLRDLDWEEDCELVPLRASDEQLIVRFFSERRQGRLCFYPDAAGQGLIVEYTDIDFYRRRPPLEPEPAHETGFFPRSGAEPPDWALGTWVEDSSGSDFLHLARGEEEGHWRLALWCDREAVLPRLLRDESTGERTFDWTESDAAPLTGRKRSYRRILEIPIAGREAVEMVWRGRNALNRRIEATLFFNEARRAIWLRYTHRFLARREPLS